MAKSNATILALRMLTLTALFALMLLLVFLLVDQTLPGLRGVLEQGNQRQIEAYLRGSGGVRGMGLAMLLQFLQIVSVVFPGAPIQVATGIIYGTWKGFLLCQVGYVGGNAAAFLLARRFHKQLAQLLPLDTAKVKGNIITKSSYPELMVFLTCLLPLFPNGLVPHAATRTRIKFRGFVLAVWSGCIPSLLLLNAVGNRLLQGDFRLALLYGAVLIGGIALLYLKRKEVIGFATGIRDKLTAGNREKSAS